MKLASHNSLTYLPCKKWYMIPFNFVAKCQRVSLERQYVKYGIRMFDFRVAFNKASVPYICHGLMDYKGDIYDFLEYLNKHKDTRVRIILEKENNKNSEELFVKFCKALEQSYPNIRFFGGIKKKGWKQLYKFKYNPKYDDKYASNNTANKTTGIIIDDLYPYIYARLNNEKNIKKGTDKSWLFIDFIDIR